MTANLIEAEVDGTRMVNLTSVEALGYNTHIFSVYSTYLTCDLP
jgi:hypothetical protein